MLFISFCTEDCNVELTIFPLFLEDIILSITWGDIFGKLGGAVGKGSLLASCNSVLSISPTKCNRSNKRFLFAINFSLFLPGCIKLGAFGNTAKVLASAQLKFSGLRPKYLQEAASKPTTLPPIGA